MNHAKRMVLVPENTLERLQQRQQILTPPVTQTLKNLDAEMNEILSSKELDDEQKAKLYNQVLQRYLTFYDQRKGQPLHVKLATSKPAVEKPQPEENKESQQEETQETHSTAMEQEVMKSVPKLYKGGARQLLDKIKENRDVLHWNEKGELIYESKPISGSHVVDLVNDILRQRKGFEPVGWSVFARGLAKMNVPENLEAQRPRGRAPSENLKQELERRLQRVLPAGFPLHPPPHPLRERKGEER